MSYVMVGTIQKHMSQHLILTTGIYDLIKEQVRRRKVSDIEGERLLLELKHAKQVRRRDLPDDVVSIDSRVTIKNHESGAEEVHTFVPPGKARQRHKTQSIITPMGLALVGYKPGSRIKWPFNGGQEKELEILKVERI